MPKTHPTIAVKESRAALLEIGPSTGLSGFKLVYVIGKGLYEWQTGDQSANIAAGNSQDNWIAPSEDTSGKSGAWKLLHAQDTIIVDPEHATDSATDTYVSATNTTPPADGVKITRDFQSANTTTAPTLDGKTMTTRDGSALWAGAVSGPHELQYASGTDTYLVLEPAFPPNPTVQVFSASGTWNRPAGCRRVIIEVLGAGGGGGGKAATGAGESAVGAGGAGGGYALKILDVTGVSSSTITVGSGGSGGAAGNNGGSSGGDSSWADGTLTVTGSGGAGGSGSAATSVDVNNNGGRGGGATNGDFNVTGGDGGFGLIRGGDTYNAGDGGHSVWGGLNARGFIGGAGVAGNQYGGGGSGALRSGSEAATAGGDGADGLVVIKEFY